MTMITNDNTPKWDKPQYITAPVQPNWYSGPAPVSRLDFFAAAALQGLCANPTYSDMNEEHTANWAWSMAKVMIEQEPK